MTDATNDGGGDVNQASGGAEPSGGGEQTDRSSPTGGATAGNGDGSGRGFRGGVGARDPRRSVPGLAAVAVALTAAVDWLFYQQVVGWTVGLFTLALVAALWLVNPQARRRRAARWLTLAALAVAGALMYEPGPLRVVVAAGAVLGLALTCRLGWTDRPVEWAQRVATFTLTGWMRWLADWHIVRRFVRRRGRPRRVWSPSVGQWVVPVLLTAVFVGLFAAANPVIEGWVSEAGVWAGKLPLMFEVARIALWVIVGMWAWALLRVRPLATATVSEMSGLPRGSRVRSVSASSVETPGFGISVSAASVVRCLILFNLVFAIETATDLSVILSNGAALPEGVSYASYAQRGAYPLVAAALLAAVFTLVSFGRHAVGEGWRAARVLVCVWLVQNVLLVVSAAWRLGIYIEAFHLTRWRIAAAIWMVLVIVGLLTIALRLIRHYDNAWLLKANTAALAAVLFACCFFNFDRLIADYNVAHARELGLGESRTDVEYLGNLGHDALPALERLAAESTDPAQADYAEMMATVVRVRLAEKLDGGWRAWTWSRLAMVAPTVEPSRAHQ